MSSPDVLSLQAPAGPLRGTFELPGSKSETNRLLTLAIQYRGQLTLHGTSDAEDAQVMLDFMHGLGFTTQRAGSALHISMGAPQEYTAAKPLEVDLRQAGTALRFISAVCCTQQGHFRLSGTPRLSQRPIEPLLHCLKQAGASLSWQRGSTGVFPIKVAGSYTWYPEAFHLDSAASSQLLSALLLLAPNLNPGTHIHLLAPPATPTYVQMTLALLERHGIVWLPTSSGYELEENTPQIDGATVEADWSAASYALGLLALMPGTLHLPRLRSDSLQGDRQQLAWFEHMGLSLAFTTGGLTAINDGIARVPAFDWDFTAMPDLAQTFAVLATQAAGPCTLRGLHTLPLKETDRLDALATELRALGQTVHTGPDWLRIEPALLQPSRPIRTYHDHRMAMAFALLAAVQPGIQLEAPHVVAKSFPAFWQQLQALGFVHA